MTENNPPILLQVQNLKKHFPVRGGLFRRQIGAVQAVDGISFSLYQGETLGLVGGAGSGKSTAVRTILNLIKPTSGTITFNNQDLTRLNKNGLRKMRRKMQMLFQDPYLSLSPRIRVGDAIGEPLTIHHIGTSADREGRIAELMKMVGLNPYFNGRFPHEFSGAQRQRISIARAMATQPELIVADEPTAALDPVVQDQIVALLKQLQQQFNLTILYVAQDLKLVEQICDRIAVFYLGRIVEVAETAVLFNTPRHPYTHFLLSNLPLADQAAETRRQKIVLTGNNPDPTNPPAGCRFHPRCSYATDLCRQEDPAIRILQESNPSHQVACHHAEQFNL